MSICHSLAGTILIPDIIIRWFSIFLNKPIVSFLQIETLMPQGVNQLAQDNKAGEVKAELPSSSLGVPFLPSLSFILFPSSYSMWVKHIESLVPLQPLSQISRSVMALLSTLDWTT